MKKGLLSLLVVALTVVGCQDYDDQFDSLNKEILALKNDLTTIKGLTTALAGITTQISALEGKMVTDTDITGILTQIAAVKTAVAAIPAPADVSGISTEVADLNSEIATILEQLTKIQAASGGTYAGNLNITNAVQLTAAEDIVDSSADGPKMTITGNVNVDADNTYATNTTDGPANILRVQAILNKLKVVSGNVSVTGVDVPLTAPELLYVTGGVEIEGSSSMGLPKLNTVDGAVELNLYGDLSYPVLSTVTGGVLLSGSVASITTVDLSTLTTGIVTTGTGSLTLTKATSVKVGSFPVSVTLAAATTVEAHGTADLSAGTTVDAPKATALTILSQGYAAGLVRITADLALVTLGVKTSAATATISGASVVADALTTISAAATISATSLSADALKTVSHLTLTSIATAAFPALTTLSVSFTGAAVTAFTAPKLAVGSTSYTIDLKAGAAVSVKSIGHAVSFLDSPTISSVTLDAQGTDLALGEMVSLATLDYTSTAIGGTLTVSSSMVSLTTLTIQSDSKLKTLTVSGSNMVTLETDGVILNTNIVNNTKLATLGFSHTHLNGQLATTVDIIDNVALIALDMSSLGKVKEVEVTGNTSLTTFTAPSFANKAEPQVAITVTMTGNYITGTYSPTVAATETTPIIVYVSSSAAISSWKTFIDGYSTTNTVTFNLDIDAVDNDEDGSFDDLSYSNAANHASTISSTAQLAKF